MTRVDAILRRIALHPVTLILLLGAAYFARNYRVPADFIVGVLTVCAILHCATDTPLGRVARRVLESRVAVWLGMISYSLYLFHGPLLQLAHRAILEPLGLPAGERLAALCILAVPLVVGASWVAYRLFERPFIGRSSQPPKPVRATGPAHSRPPQGRAAVA